MQILVLGAGVVGVTSAYYLARAGHEVTVVDRQPGVALETSFANAGQVSPGYAAPWAAPGIPRKALRWLFARHAPLVLHPSLDPALLRWLAAMLRNCTETRYHVNKARMMRLAEYSRDCLRELRQDTALTYDQGTLGTLQVFRTQQQLDASAKDVAILRELGVPHDLLDRDGCLLAEPALASATAPIAGGLRLPGDETGDCHVFTTALARKAEALGVRFLQNVTIEGIDTALGMVEAVRTSAGRLDADRYLLALGSFSPAMVRGLGLRLPIYPVKGYSLTVPVTDASGAPRSTVLDETYKVALTRLGDRIRVGGMAELAGFDLSLPERRRETLALSLGSLFPHGGRERDAAFWCGLRPMTPDGTPVIGGTPLPNLFTNCGHGTLGWTMACGSAQLVADLISGRTPAIETADLALSRYL
ncbi:D-amino acid dehydrogenase [Novosphingobium naphthalenivorans]|uniref:D-amino acid dehydrogenase n=1 Tax=Novosphingobium naphthalenivorans TaxID=273168 RepID=UPI0008314865|nr:D-amino acid dehydrogenase [Novosphingobium naphthalenivorans]